MGCLTFWCFGKKHKSSVVKEPSPVEKPPPPQAFLLKSMEYTFRLAELTNAYKEPIASPTISGSGGYSAGRDRRGSYVPCPTSAPLGFIACKHAFESGRFRHMLDLQNGLKD